MTDSTAKTRESTTTPTMDNTNTGNIFHHHQFCLPQLPQYHPSQIHFPQQLYSYSPSPTHPLPTTHTQHHPQPPQAQHHQYFPYHQPIFMGNLSFEGGTGAGSNDNTTLSTSDSINGITNNIINRLEAAAVVMGAMGGMTDLSPAPHQYLHGVSYTTPATNNNNIAISTSHANSRIRHRSDIEDVVDGLEPSP